MRRRLHRACLIPLLAFASAATIFPCRGIAAEAAATPKAPNVLFIAIDDLNDWVGVTQGYPADTTPNIDELAKRGVLFSNAHCAAPACNPSRAALMSGLAPHHTGVYHNSQPWRPALPDAVTLNEYFSRNGYSVEGAGKIFHGGYADKHWDNYGAFGRDAKPPVLPANGITHVNVGHFDWGPLGKDEAMKDEAVAAYAESFLAKKHDKPFFLAIGFSKPHLPFYAPQRYFDKWPLEKIQLPNVPADDLSDIPAAGIAMAKPKGDHKNVVDTDNWKKAIRGYLACTSFVDEMVGRVVTALDQSDYARDTIIVLWTDHGWHLGEKQHWRKFALWEEATRTPLIFVVPGVTKAGEQCSRPVSLLDLYPTLVQLSHLPPKPDLDGHSLVPLLENPSAPWPYLALTTEGRENHAVRSDDFRYIRYRDGSEELYDHRSDPGEFTNLAGDPKWTSVKEELGKGLPTENAPDAPREKSTSALKKAARKIKAQNSADKAEKKQKAAKKNAKTGEKSPQN